MRVDAGARWLALELWASALFPLQRHAFAIRDEGLTQQVHQLEAVVGRLSAGMIVELD